MWMIIIALSAMAVTPEVVNQRLEEIESLRANRLVDAPKISNVDYRNAAAGKVPTGMVSVDGFSYKKGYGVRVFDLPIDTVWSALNDDRGKLEHTKLSHAELLGGRYCESGRRVFQFLPLPFVSDRWWVSDFRFNEKIHQTSSGRVREMFWKSIDPNTLSTKPSKEWMDKGIPVNFNEGAWFVVDLDGSSTLVEYYAWSDPSGYIPASLTNSLAAGGIKDTIDAVRKIASEGSNCSKK